MESARGERYSLVRGEGKRERRRFPTPPPPSRRLARLRRHSEGSEARAKEVDPCTDRKMIETDRRRRVREGAGGRGEEEGKREGEPRGREREREGESPRA